MKRPTQAAYNKLERATERKLVTATNRLASGKIDVEAWQDKIADILADKHAAAAALGRQRAGDFTERNKDDDVFGQVMATEEARYLGWFADDVTGGRYTLEDGTLDADRLNSRVTNYSRKLLATANEGFVQASDAADTFDWHQGATEDSCSECPELAKGGPYTAATIPTYPRAGATKCLFHCKCALVRQDGINGFLPPDGQV